MSSDPQSFTDPSLHTSPYVELTTNDAVGGGNTMQQQQQQQLTAQEVALLKQLLARNNSNNNETSALFPRTSSSSNIAPPLPSALSQDSDYPEYLASTHAWAVFADHPQKRATTMDRIVGTLIIAFQLFTYWLFAQEAVQDYQTGAVAVTTLHSNCLASNEQPQDHFTCEAEFTSHLDAFCAFFMLGIFLTGDFLQAGRVILNAPTRTGLVFAFLAGIEVVAAYLAACVAVSYNLYIGEVTDAVEVGVGLLFIRELSQRAYAGIRNGEGKQYKTFFSVLTVLIVIGMISDPFCEYLFAVRE